MHACYLHFGLALRFRQMVSRQMAAQVWRVACFHEQRSCCLVLPCSSPAQQGARSMSLVCILLQMRSSATLYGNWRITMDECRAIG